MKSVLVLEDESAVMRLLRQMLKQYSLLEASTPEQAFLAFEENNRTIGLLIADASLPTSSGIQVALLPREKEPELPVILTSQSPVCSWSGQDSSDLSKLDPDLVIILQKPFQTRILLESVRSLIGSPQLPAAGIA